MDFVTAYSLISVFRGCYLCEYVASFLNFFVLGVMTDDLRNFLGMNLPKVKEGKKAKFSLGLSEPKLGSHIHEETKIPCQSNEFVLELLRGVRLHFEKYISNLKVCALYLSAFY